MAATRSRWSLFWLLLPIVACDETSAGAPVPDESDVAAACQRMCERQDECGQLAASTVDLCNEACQANLTEDCVESRWDATIDARDVCEAGTCEALGDCLAAAQCVESGDEDPMGEEPTDGWPTEAHPCDQPGMSAICPVETVTVGTDIQMTYCLGHRSATDVNLDAWAEGCVGEPGVVGPECAPGMIGACQWQADQSCITQEYTVVTSSLTLADLKELCAGIDGRWIER